MKKFILSTCLYTHLAALSPDIFIYTDFGGGKNLEELVSDLQTSGEIASAAWKATQHPALYINDSAVPLNPRQAALRLAATFPYEPRSADGIERIVVHVIDPGVGNDQTEEPRALVLRKDGTLFIGPDNGTLSFACPVGSIACSNFKQHVIPSQIFIAPKLLPSATWVWRKIKIKI